MGGGTLKRRLAAVTSLLVLASCVHASSAFAIQFHVNGATGNDTNTCLQASVGIPPAGPCDTIGHALTLAAGNAGPDDVLVADGTYVESLGVGSGTSVRALEASPPKPVINNTPAALAAVTIVGSGGSLEGFEVRSAHLPLAISGPGTVTGNVFPTTTPPTLNADIRVDLATGVATIANNQLNDDGVSAQNGIFIAAPSTASVLIDDNDISGLQTAIFKQSGGSSPVISANTISGVHTGGHGVLVYQGSPVITANTITAGAGITDGVNVSDTNGPAGAALSRNTISGLSYGVVVAYSGPGPPLPVTLSGDLVTDNSVRGLETADFGPGGADVTATNVTLFDNVDADIRLQDTNLVLDSSIVDDVSRIGTATCSISFSRGFALASGDPTNCDDFQSTANPMFAGPGDYHLLAASPMIGAGNPADPGAGALDIDGGPRALLSAPGCTPRRDIGADEYAPAPAIVPSCPQKAGPPVSGGKKCKKGKKLKTVKGKKKCVKKKKRRKGAGAG